MEFVFRLLVLEGFGKTRRNASEYTDLTDTIMCGLQQSDFILREGQDREAPIICEQRKQRLEIEMISHDDLLMKTGRQVIGAKHVRGAEECKPISRVQPE